MAETKVLLGDRLIERGLLTQAQLEVALSEQRRAYRPLGEILVSLGFVHAEDTARLLADDLGVPFLRAGDIDPDPELFSVIDADFVRASGAIPVSLQDGVLTVALTDPADLERVSAVRARFPYPLRLALTTEADLLLLVRQHLPERDGRVSEIFAGLGQAASRFNDDFPVEEVTRALLLDGVHRGATDVHIEPEEKVTRVRYRVDGLLEQGESLPRAATDAIVSRIKVLARLDIAERRRPQDGRLRIDVDDRAVDMRVSIVPNADGENVVLRILDRAATPPELSLLGFPSEAVARLQHVVRRPHGLFLVTGPTGSGKTTTLYSMLAHVDAMRRKVATIEDPIEVRMPLVRQSQVDPSIGYGFLEGLRALLRQDPDVILVGEIRDQETASMAIKASMTGHLVLSTLHTNSALGALPRLIDLGIDPFLIEDSLVGVLGQRLVRKVCGNCARPWTPDERELAWLGGVAGTPRSGAGCSRCSGSGYSGRMAIHELFLPDDSMEGALRGSEGRGALRDLARGAGFVELLEAGRDKVRQGRTTMAEVQRVCRGQRIRKEELEAL